MSALSWAAPSPERAASSAATASRSPFLNHSVSRNCPFFLPPSLRLPPLPAIDAPRSGWHRRRGRRRRGGRRAAPARRAPARARPAAAASSGGRARGRGRGDAPSAGAAAATACTAGVIGPGVAARARPTATARDGDRPRRPAPRPGRARAAARSPTGGRPRAAARSAAAAAPRPRAPRPRAAPRRDLHVHLPGLGLVAPADRRDAEHGRGQLLGLADPTERRGRARRGLAALAARSRSSMNCLRVRWRLAGLRSIARPITASISGDSGARADGGGTVPPAAAAGSRRRRRSNGGAPVTAA
jgi:translation initiation factor IF-2